MSQRTRVALGPAKPGNNQPAYPKLRISLVLSLWSLFSLFKQEGGWLWELKPKLPKKGDDQPIRLYIRGRPFKDSPVSRLFCAQQDLLGQKTSQRQIK